jgi:hypothetical protein
MSTATFNLRSSASSINLNAWIEITLGTLTATTTYITGLILLKTFTTQDLQNLQQLSENLGPLKPIIHHITNTMTRYTKPETP